MTEQAERYDRIAEGYAEWWAPVLAPGVAQLLDEIASRLTGDERLVDIGTGTGQLGLGALARWPGLTIDGIDASSEMAAMGGIQADRSLSAAVRPRYRTTVAFADALPFEDATFDGAVSSFVLQLVPNRARALREARRVLRPGGFLAHATWLQGGHAFLPDAIFDEVLDEIGLEERPVDGRSGDIRSVDRAAGELRRAGFADVTARSAAIDHRFSVDGYIAFLTEFDEETLFAELEPDERTRVTGTLRSRLEPLSASAMTMHLPIVVAVGRRSR